MNKAYDRSHAQRLLPLLQSIGQEITERTHEVRILQGRIALHERRGGDLENLLDLKATLSSHRRELRYAQKELERLGCSLDQNHPLRILIPGADGQVEHGFAWEANDPTLRRVSTGTAIT